VRGVTGGSEASPIPSPTTFVERTQLELLEDRYRALRDVAREADLHANGAASRLLLRFVLDAATTIIEAMNTRSHDGSAASTVTGAKVYVVASLHERLTRVLAYVKPSPVPVPPEVAASFRRIVRQISPNAELLLTVSGERKFVFTNVMNDDLRAIAGTLWTELGLELPFQFSFEIVHVRLPSSEVTQVLLHSIFAHEFGHYFIANAGGPKPKPQFEADAAYFVTLDQDDRATAATVANAWQVEIAADLYAMFLFGPAYVCAAMVYVTSLHDMDAASVSHPPFWLRLRILIDALNENFTVTTQDDDGNTGQEIPWQPRTASQLTRWLMRSQNTQRFGCDGVTLTIPVGVAAIAALSDREVVMRLRRYAHRLAEVAGDGGESSLYTGLLYKSEVPQLVKSINLNVVPVELYVDNGTRGVMVASIMNAAWECFFDNLNEFSRHLKPGMHRSQLLRFYNDFLLKTFELAELARDWAEVSREVDEPPVAAGRSTTAPPSISRPAHILSAARIRELATTWGPGTEDWLAIAPVLRWDRQAKPGNASIDVRLGQRFRVPQRTRIDSLDHVSPQHQRNIEVYYDDHFVPIGDFFVLHPRQFVLGVTLEWMRLPGHLCASVIGRSAWGRDGLIVATATTIHPRYAGVLTLELTNVGEIPIRLYPGLTIAQLTVQPVEGVSGEETSAAFMLSAYPRSADAARDDRNVIARFSKRLAERTQDVVLSD
jgi:dCTP deaminase